MKSLFNPSEYRIIRQRIEQLSPLSVRVWGNMEVDQMLAHCNCAMDQAIGTIPFVDKSNFLMRTLVRQLVLRGIRKERISKGTATFPEFVITGRYAFETEKQKLLTKVDSFFQLREADINTRHPYFGPFSKEQFGSLQHLHLDHHLKQFGV